MRILESLVSEVLSTICGFVVCLCYLAIIIVALIAVAAFLGL